MRNNQTLAINCGDLKIDFKDQWNDPDTISTNDMMNFAEWLKEEVHTKYIMPEEYTNNTFEIGKEFTIVIISTA